ncbi:hypothetical protein Tco_0877627 [Tanacetum coccineum]|uniref:Uncharacterized protein n=1 Tax=Tanacetum coccineum TaxID=301880 RepID=A0ABQ5BVN3_9ASTR
MARKGLHTSVDKDDSEDSDEVGEQEESVTGKMNGIAYKMLIIMEKQAGVAIALYTTKWLSVHHGLINIRTGMPEPSSLGKDFSNPFMVDKSCK